MASKLIALARQSAEVRQVIAHTLPLQNASTRVLRRVGMTCVGAVVDPEDGNVWRWQLRVSRPSMTSTRVFRPGTAYLVALLMTLPSCLLADIYRWDTGAVIPGTAGIVPGPGVNLSGWASEQQNLMYADFSNGIDLSQSHLYSSWLQNARFTAANLESANLNAADLTNVDFRQANLVGANLGRAILTGVDLTNADVRDTSLWSATAHGFTPQQLYSTSSYQSHDLRNIRFWDDDLSGWDLVGQNLTGADFEDASLSNANLTGASLIRVNLEQTVLENTQLDLADLRRASAWSEYELSRASTINTILPDGGVQGLDLSSGQRLRVRDADLTITVHDTMRMGGGSALALVLPDGAWGSTIAFHRHPGHAWRQSRTDLRRRCGCGPPGWPHAAVVRLDWRRAQRDDHRLEPLRLGSIPPLHNGRSHTRARTRSVLGYRMAVSVVHFASEATLTWERDSRQTVRLEPVPQTGKGGSKTD